MQNNMQLSTEELDQQKLYHLLQAQQMTTSMLPLNSNPWNPPNTSSPYPNIPFPNTTFPNPIPPMHNSTMAPNMPMTTGNMYTKDNLFKELFTNTEMVEYLVGLGYPAKDILGSLIKVTKDFKLPTINEEDCFYINPSELFIHIMTKKLKKVLLEKTKVMLNLNTKE